MRRLALAIALGGSAACAADLAVIPDPTLTPGVVRTTDADDICTHGTRSLRHWSRERDDMILLEYGLEPGAHPDVEIDHLIPLGVGGADDDRNLWPEPRRSIEPVWNAEAKDRLEMRLHNLICAHAIDPAEAQAAFRDDWTVAARETRSDDGREPDLRRNPLQWNKH